MMVLFYFSCFVMVIYCIFIAVNIYYVQTEFPKVRNVKQKLSIIIPCRNEGDNIGHCLRSILHQTLPYSQYEIIIVDDFSEDDTVKIANEFKARLPLTVLHNSIAGKKNALMTGIAYAVNDIIITTDADCTMAPGWLSSMLQIFHAGQLNMLCGPINFNNSPSLFQQLQQTESAAIVGISAVMLDKRKPATCNGANLMFSKSIFNRISGYGSHSELATGDDDLLMHGFYAHDAGKVAYTLNYNAMVHTKASTGLMQFLQQRTRWLSKRKYYVYKWNNYLQALVIAQLAAFYFVFVFGIMTGSLLALCMVLNKFIFDLMFGIQLKKVFNFRFWQILLMPFFELYILLVMLYGLFFKKKWKGRTL